MTKLFHLYIKATSEDKYYSTLTGVFLHNSIGTTRNTLFKHDWTKPYENEICILKMGEFVRALRK